MPAVTRAWSTGGYGTTVWHHLLECGHVESRRRRWAKPSMACTVCDQLAALPPPDTPDVTQHLPDPDGEPVGPDRVAGQLETAARWRAGIAARLGIPPDQVEVGVEDGAVAGAVVFLTPQQVAAMVNPPPTSV